jgi:hypothetical protein
MNVDRDSRSMAVVRVDFRLKAAVVFPTPQIDARLRGYRRRTFRQQKSNEHAQTYYADDDASLRG